jgi:hypothetical protein
MSILKRAPGDQFSFRLFFQLISKIKKSKDTFYFWSSCIDPCLNKISHFIGEQEFYETEIIYRNYIMSEIKNNLVVLGIKDHLTSGDFNKLINNKPVIVEYLETMFDYYSEKQFILFTSVENLESYIQKKNVIIIPWGGDITNHQKEYLKLEPVLEKNFDSQTTYLSLNRNQRTHRAMLVSLIYYLDIQGHGLISCMFKEKVADLFEYSKWQTNKQQLFEKGFKLFKQQELVINDDYDIYTTGQNDNVGNFKNSLTDYYKDTFVEIITETSYTESCYNLTEKTLNSIYGCSFPILLCSQGSVEFLRNIGMDMFDDVVDHSYDRIADPTDRLYRAIVDNIELLTNNQKTKELWKKHEHRFVKNVDFAKSTLYNFYSSRAKHLLSKAINDYNL